MSAAPVGSPETAAHDGPVPRPASAAGAAVLLLSGTLLAGVAISSAPGGHQLRTTLLPAVVGVALLLLGADRARVAAPGLRAIARPAGAGLLVAALAALLLLATGLAVFVGGAIGGSVLQSVLGAEIVSVTGLLVLVLRGPRA